MKPLNLAQTRPASALADVALPQTYPFGEISYHFGHLSAKLYLGRTQAAFASQRGLDQRAVPLAALQEYRRRGCLRAKSYLHCASWLSPQHVRPRPKKSSTSTSLFRLSQPTPANTSKTFGRAADNLLGRPARFPDATVPTPNQIGGGLC